MTGPPLFFFYIYKLNCKFLLLIDKLCSSVVGKFCSSVVGYSSVYLKGTSSKFIHLEWSENWILIHSFSKYKNLKENIKLSVLFVSSLTYLKFYISVLESYISNLGSRPALVHFWDYIFRIWITVYRDQSPDSKATFKRNSCNINMIMQMAYQE
jgi:hypothetical protein